MRTSLAGVVVALMAAGLHARAGQDCWFSSVPATGGMVQFALDVPREQARVIMEQSTNLAQAGWSAAAVQRPVAGQTQTCFSAAFSSVPGRCFFRARTQTNHVASQVRMRMLYNGYFLTADAQRALPAITANYRYRLYCFNALLVNPATGRIAAVWPPLPGNFPGETNVARAAADVPELAYETPPSPSNNAAAIVAWWLAHGVAASLLQNLDAVDLNGAVVTPGLIDDHFHVSILGLRTNDNTNPMRMTPEQALAAMTFWGAYAGNSEHETGALAAPWSDPGGPGWLADFVVWEKNPLAIRGPGFITLESLATNYYNIAPADRNQMINVFMQKFRPALTVAGGIPMYTSPDSCLRWQGRPLQ